MELTRPFSLSSQLIVSLNTDHKNKILCFQSLLTNLIPRPHSPQIPKSPQIPSDSTITHESTITSDSTTPHTPPITFDSTVTSDPLDTSVYFHTKHLGLLYHFRHQISDITNTLDHSLIIDTSDLSKTSKLLIYGHFTSI